MTTSAEQPRRPRSQRPSLRRSDDWTPLPSVLVDGRRYERMADPDGRELVEIPGVPGSAATEPIPERLARFAGIPVCVEINVRQTNRYVGAEVPLGPEAGDVSVGFVGGLTGWSVALDGVTVYGGMSVERDALPSLIRAAAAVPRLLGLPFRAWDEADWISRRVYLDGRPARVAAMLPGHGLVALVAEEGSDGFGHDGDGPIMELHVDLLSDRIGWAREPDRDRQRAEEDGDGC